MDFYSLPPSFSYSSCPLLPPLGLRYFQKLYGKVFETNASLLRRHSVPVDPPPLWKMKRFSKVSLILFFPSSHTLCTFLDTSKSKYLRFRQRKRESICLPHVGLHRKGRDNRTRDIHHLIFFTTTSHASTIMSKLSRVLHVHNVCV